MESVVCDFCGGGDALPVARQTDKLHGSSDEVFTIVRCSSCGLHYVNPRPPRNAIGKYYPAGYAFHFGGSRIRRLVVSMLEVAANNRLATPLGAIGALSRRLAAHVKPPIDDPVRDFYRSGGTGAFLDIGCGAGQHAHFWGHRGSLAGYRRLADVYGVETADSARGVVTAAGVPAFANLGEVPANLRFGAIRMNWSMEHVHSPSEYFAFITQRLVAGGRAVVAVPNYDGLLYRLAPDCVEVPVHLYDFRPQDLRNYPDRFGLKVLELRTFSYPQMFVEAAKTGMLPEVFERYCSWREALRLLRALEPLDAAGHGNNIIAVLATDRG